MVEWEGDRDALEDDIRLREVAVEEEERQISEIEAIL